MKQLFSGKAFYSLLVGATVLFSFTTVADRADFSGEWKLDESKSELGDFGGRIPTAVQAEQTDNSITITRTAPGFNGGDPITTTMTLTFDGKVTETEGFGGSVRKSTANWSEDEQILTINGVVNLERNGQSIEIKMTETWTMTKDGLLSIVTHSTTPRGEGTTKAIYSR